MSNKEKNKLITQNNLKGKIQTLKIQISEQENMGKLLQSKLTETQSNVLVLRGKLVAFAELLQELTGQPARGAQRQAPPLPPPTPSKKKSSSKRKKTTTKPKE